MPASGPEAAGGGLQRDERDDELRKGSQPGVSREEVRALGLFYGAEAAKALVASLGWKGAVAQLHRELAEKDQAEADF